jgi:FkbM family methyltransferase
MLPQTARLAIFRALHGKGLTRLPGVRRLAEVMKSRRGSRSVVHGFPVELDANDTCKLSVFGVYEPFETELVRNHLAPGNVVLDVGAHIGYYTLLSSKLVGPAGRVYAFEPTPDTFAILERNARTNERTNVTPVNAACGAHSGTATLYLNPANAGDNHLFSAEDSAGPPVAVRIVAVDDYLPADTTVDFVKMDVQGWEPAALRGMERTLSRGPRVTMMCEFWPSGMRRAGFDPEAFLGQLEDLGFRYRHVDRARKALVEKERRELLSTEWIVEKGTNLWCERS